MNIPGPHINAFNERVKIMNQTNKKDIIMTCQDARNLHSDIFTLLSMISELSAKSQQNSEESTIEVQLDGGAF
jgi:hypothetical protein